MESRWWTSPRYLKLITWQNLTFFPYELMDTVRSSITSVCAHSATIFPGNDKTSMTTKFHVVFGHASPRRTRVLMKYHGKELSSELPCVCQICAPVKSSAPSRRKYEHRHVSAEEVTGNHFKSTNTDIQRSIDEMIESDERSAQYEKLQQIQSDLIRTPDSELTKINDHVPLPLVNVGMVFTRLWCWLTIFPGRYTCMQWKPRAKSASQKHWRNTSTKCNYLSQGNDISISTPITWFYVVTKDLSLSTRRSNWHSQCSALIC